MAIGLGLLPKPQNHLSFNLRALLRRSTINAVEAGLDIAIYSFTDLTLGATVYVTRTLYNITPFVSATVVPAPFCYISSYLKLICACKPTHDHQELFTLSSTDRVPANTAGPGHKMSSGSRVRGDPWLIQVITPVAVLVTAVVGVRFSLRYFRRTGFWFDDWFILASLILVWGMYTVSVLSVEIGGIGTPFRVNDETDPSRVWLGNFLRVC